MTNRTIREQQRRNSFRLDKDGNALIRQRRFPSPTNTLPVLFRGKRPTYIREMARRKAQIERGQITPANGLIT